MSVIDSISNVNDYIDIAGISGYIDRMQKKSSTINQYSEVLRRRNARNQFAESDYAWKPSSIIADIRDSANVSGLGASVQQLRHEVVRTSSHNNNPFSYTSNQYMESYYNYINRQNEVNNLTLNNVQMAQQFHQYQNTSSSEYIRFKNRSINKNNGYNG